MKEFKVATSSIPKLNDNLFPLYYLLYLSVAFISYIREEAYY